MNLTAPAPQIQTGFTLDPSLLAQRRRDSARRIHTAQIPAIRAIGFAVLCLIALLQDLRSSGTIDWMQLNRLVAINLLYAAISWLVLRRFYGRTGRTIYTSIRRRSGDIAVPVCINGLSLAAAESVPAHETDDLSTTIRHARISREHAMEFWARVEALTREFTQLPREGDTVYGFVAGIYPTDFPTLPDPDVDV